MIELPTDAEPVRIIQGDCLDMMPRLPANTFDSIVSDPPYGLGFMGKQWDHGVPGVPFWTEAKRVLKPGAYMLVMGGSRTYHRLACAVEDAGFEIRDCLMWIYGSGFPKAKSCLKPAYEPILLCRKPGKGMRELGIDECRIPSGSTVRHNNGGTGNPEQWRTGNGESFTSGSESGRWPANVLHDGSEEVLEAFAVYGEKTSGKQAAGGHVRNSDKTRHAYGEFTGQRCEGGDSGSAARFFYAAKASKSERGDGNSHPTVKPLALMEWLVKLVTPPNGLTLDPFAGSGTTGKASRNTGRRAVLIEREAAYADIARRRVAVAMGTGLLAGIA